MNLYMAFRMVNFAARFKMYELHASIVRSYPKTCFRFAEKISRPSTLKKEKKMAGKTIQTLIAVILAVFLVSCASTKANIPVTSQSVQPSSTVTFKGNSLKLLGEPIAVGNPLPVTRLVDSLTMKAVDLSQHRGGVLLLSIVPSIDTKVCEAQTHYLGEEGERMPREVKRLVISRDLPFAQNRFAEEAKLTHLQYLSDYKSGEFGRSTGLLADGLMLLARSVLVVDGDGIVRYIQVVPEITQLPDMEKAFDEAVKLLE
jgi:thiol peroxidase